MDFIYWFFFANPVARFFWSFFRDPTMLYYGCPNSKKAEMLQLKQKLYK
ncbi:MAG: hypothetical protein IJM10_01925 [Clostridia bacterium]|nr:hypothetical protein [Clostridia bacterium]